MAYVHEIKFFLKDQELYAALFDNPPFFCNEFWIKNVRAKELKISTLPENVQLEKKYKVEELKIKPFHATKPEFEFIDKLAQTAWETGARLSGIAFSQTDKRGIVVIGGNYNEHIGGDYNQNSRTI